MEMTEMSYNQRGPKKPVQKGKLISSMKKKYLNGVEVMDTELRKNVPVSQVRKEDAEFTKAMEHARVRNEREKAEKEKEMKARANKAPLKPSAIASGAMGMGKMK
jgi:regulator of protease activity HflC (stomatin/prohibitin superfamily)